MRIRSGLLAASLALMVGGAVAAPVNVTTIVGTLGPEALGATGSGFTTMVFDPADNTLSIVIDWSGLSGTTTVAHIHCCTATAGTGAVGVAVTPGTLPGFPTGLQSGHYEVEIDLDLPGSFTGGFRNNFGGGTQAGAIDALFQGIADGKAYLNLHTSPVFGGGEIRAFLQLPEPTGLGLAALGMAGLVGVRRRR